MNRNNQNIRQSCDKLISIYQADFETKPPNQNSLNIECENIFRDVLNIAYDWELINLNQVKANFPAIDLGDKKHGVGIQVTAKKTVDKVEYTLSQYEIHNLVEEYPNLYIFILGKKNKYRKEKEYSCKFIDFGTIKSKLIDINDTNKLLRIEEKLKNTYIEQLEPYKNTLLSEVKVNTTGNYTSYIEYAIKEYGYVSNEEKDSLSKDIKYLEDTLKKLSQDARSLVADMIKHEIDYDRGQEYICFDYNGLVNRLSNRIGREELVSLFNELYNRKHVTDPLDDDNWFCRLYFGRPGSGFCILNSVYGFYKENNKDIARMLVYLDFTDLD